MSVLRSIVSTTMASAALLLAADTLRAQSRSIHARPGWLCPGDQYAIQWEGPRDVRILNGSTATPYRDGLVFRTDSAIAVRAVGSSGDTLSMDSVGVHPDRMEHNLVRPVASCAGRISLTSMAIPPANASDRITPRSVANRGPRPVVVMHRSVVVRLAPGEQTTVFNSVPFSGDWAVIVDTGAYNSFCPVSAAPPATAPSAQRIDVLIVTNCAAK